MANTFQELYEAGEALRRGHTRKAAKHIEAAVKAWQQHEQRDNAWLAQIRALTADLDKALEQERVAPVKEQTLALATVALARDVNIANETKLTPEELVALARDVLNAAKVGDLIEAATRQAPERMAELYVITLDEAS